LEHKNDPNVLILHFNDLKQNLELSIRKIIVFLGYDLNDIPLNKILMKSSFAWMRKHSHKCAPTNFDKSLSNKKAKKIKKIKSCSGKFINKGTNKRWHGVLTEEDLIPYKKVMKEFFTEKEIEWIENGGEDTLDN
jgi:aryl sulfotransferase